MPATQSSTINQSNDILRRLEKAIQDQQAAFGQTRDDVNLLKSGYGVIQRDMLSLTTSIDKLVSRFEDARKTNWPLLALFTGFLPILIGGGAYFVSSYTANSIAPLVTETVATKADLKTVTTQQHNDQSTQIQMGRDLSMLAQTTTTNTDVINRLSDRFRTVESQTSASGASDAESKTDRKNLNDRLNHIEAQVNGMQSEVREHNASVQVHLAEVEQQFHSVSNLENLRAAQQERLNAMIWEKSHPGERYPNGTFFPTSIFQGPGMIGNQTGGVPNP